MTQKWKCIYNEELYDLYCSPNFIRWITSRRMRWTVHVTYIGERRGAYRVLVGRPERKKPLERPRRRWDYTINKRCNLRITQLWGALCNHCCSGKAIIITCSECLILALVIHHAMSMRHIVIWDLPRSAVFFYIISQTAGFSRKNLLSTQYVFWFSLQIVWNISHYKDSWASFD